MITRIVKMTFRAEACDDFLILFEEFHKHIRAAEGCLSLKLLRELPEGNVFFTYSTWQDESFLELYKQSDTFGIVWPRTKMLFAEAPQAWTCKEFYDL
ncbi:MAG: putative quinol monooxygenase [Flavobacteriales bacterium]